MSPRGPGGPGRRDGEAEQLRIERDRGGPQSPTLHNHGCVLAQQERRLVHLAAGRPPLATADQPLLLDQPTLRVDPGHERGMWPPPAAASGSSRSRIRLRFAGTVGLTHHRRRRDGALPRAAARRYGRTLVAVRVSRHRMTGGLCRAGYSGHGCPGCRGSGVGPGTVHYPSRMRSSRPPARSVAAAHPAVTPRPAQGLNGRATEIGGCLTSTEG